MNRKKKNGSLIFYSQNLDDGELDHGRDLFRWKERKENFLIISRNLRLVDPECDELIVCVLYRKKRVFELKS